MQNRVATGMVITVHKLLEETVSCTYAIRQRIQLYQLKKTWDALSEFIAASLIQKKGVLVPSLGTFLVLTAPHSTHKKTSPAFELLDGRFSGVSQEMSQLNRFSKKGAVVNISYQRLSKEVSIHRSSCQRLVKNIMERLAMHIVSGNMIQITFPKVGVLLRNKAGRLQFKFAKSFLDQMNACSNQVGSTFSSHTTTRKPSPNRNARASVSRTKQANLRDNENIVEEKREEDHSSGVSSGLLLCNELDAIWKLCKQKDKSNSGTVPRKEFDKWMQQECRKLLQQIKALSLVDLLQTHTNPKDDSQVYYPSLLISLKELVQERDCQVMKIEESTSVKDTSESEADGSNSSGEENDEPDEARSLTHDSNDLESCDSDHDSYFLQKQRKNCSRKECDEFNEQHFRRLLKSRGNEVAPKVGEEPLTLAEAVTIHPRASLERRIKTAPHSLPPPTLDLEEKQGRAALLRSSWQSQIEEKAKQRESLRVAEEKWPYGPVNQPHNRIAATAPRYIHAHHVRPYDAPSTHVHTYLTNGCSYWSGL